MNHMLSIFFIEWTSIWNECRCN